MRKTNKFRTKRMSKIKMSTCYIGTLALTVFVTIILYSCAKTNCDQLLKSIGEKQRLLDRRTDELTRETARWEEMTTPEKIEVALRRQGLKMSFAKPCQNIRMSNAGVPRSGQLSVARAQQASAGRATASYKSGTR